MSNVFSKAKPAAAAIDEDYVSGGGLFDTDIYEAVIKTAYIGKASASESRNVTLLLDIKGRELRYSAWVSNKQGEVTYTDKKGDMVHALTAAAAELELVFLGLNEADSGSAVTVRAWRAKFGPTQSIPLIGDDYAALEMTGALLADGSKVGGESQYFQTFVEDTTA